VKHGADVLRGRVDAGGEPEPVGKPHAATIEQNETPNLGQGGQERPTSGLLPNAFDVRYKTRQHQNIKAASGVGLECDMYTATTDVARRWRALVGLRYAGAQQRADVGFRRHAELVAETLRQGLKVPLGGGSISGEQQIVDEVAAIDFAERIELNETA